MSRKEINQFKTSGEYLQEFVFPSLRKALEQTFGNENPDDPNPRRLVKGLDLLAQELWNLNDGDLEVNHLFLKARVKEILNET